MSESKSEGLTPEKYNKSLSEMLRLKRVQLSYSVDPRHFVAEHLETIKNDEALRAKFKRGVCKWANDNGVSLTTLVGDGVSV